jgi:phage tail assembly protein T
MTYLKKDTLNPDGENILLFELSAYSRMKYIEFMVEERKSLPTEGLSPDENFKIATLLTTRDQAMIVALSLSEADDEERDGKDIFPEIMRKYPPGLLGSCITCAYAFRDDPPVNNTLRKLKKRRAGFGKVLTRSRRFAMRLAREFGRPDWRAMLSEMSSSEWFEWIEYYQDHCFSDDLWILISPTLVISQSVSSPIRINTEFLLDFSLLATGRAER